MNIANPYLYDSYSLIWKTKQNYPIPIMWNGKCAKRNQRLKNPDFSPNPKHRRKQMFVWFSFKEKWKAVEVADSD